MKHFSITLAILVFAAVIAGAGGYQLAAVTKQQVDTALGGGYSMDNKVTDNAVPMFAVRIDDNTNDLVCLDPGVATTPADQGFYGLYWEFLKKGIPISLAINYENLGTAGFATEADIVRIIAEFDSAGVPIEIVQHGNSNFESGKEDWTYSDLQDELDPDDLETAFGRQVTAFAQPGQADALRFCRRNVHAIERVLRDSGIEYWDGAYGASADSTENVSGLWAAHNIIDGVTNPGKSTFTDRGLRPGSEYHQYRLPSAQTADLNNFYFERDASETSINTSDFTILADGDGTPADADWGLTIQYYLSGLIADRQGCVFAMHDSLQSDATYAGKFSPVHFAWMLSELEDAGFIRLGTVSEVYDWATSRWAKGTNLIPTSDLGSPMYVIGDTSGVEYPWIPGLGAKGAQGGSWVSTAFPIPPPNGTNGKPARTTNYPTDVIGPSVTGYRGTTGGFQMNSTGNRIYMMIYGLPMGYYRLSWTTSGANVDIRGIELGMAGKYTRPGSGFVRGFPTFGDTLITIYDHDGGDGGSVSSDNSTKWMSMNYLFQFSTAMAEERLSWTAEAEVTNSREPYWLGWVGGIYVELGPGVYGIYSDVDLIYLGPIDQSY